MFSLPEIISMNNGGPKPTIISNWYDPNLPIDQQKIADIDIYEEMSNCCSARVYSDLDICSDCKEHCAIVRSE